MKISQPLIDKCAAALFKAMAQRFGFNFATWDDCRDKDEWRYYVTEIIRAYLDELPEKEA